MIVSPYSPEWPVMYQQEARQLARLLGPGLSLVEHVGSTSVPGLAAKPVIDIVLGLTSLAELDARKAGLVLAGYEWLGENGIPGRRYLRKWNDEGGHSHHIHAFHETDEAIRRHLVFRDYLRIHPEEREAYARLKMSLVSRAGERKAYQSGKQGFVAALEQRALSWSTRQPP